MTGSSGGPWAKKSIKSRVLADTTGLAWGGRFDGASNTFGASFSSLSDPAITSSRSKDSLLRTSRRVRGGVGTELGPSAVPGRFFALIDDDGSDGRGEPLLRECWLLELWFDGGFDAETDRRRAPGTGTALTEVTLVWRDLVGENLGLVGLASSSSSTMESTTRGGGRTVTGIRAGKGATTEKTSGISLEPADKSALGIGRRAPR